MISIDIRSINAFRILLGIICIYNFVLYKIHFFEYFDVENGPFCFENIKQIKSGLGLLTSVQDNFVLIIIIVLSLIVFFLLSIGFYPSLMSLLSLIAYTAFTERYFPYFDGPDNIIICFLFIGIFLYYFAYPTKSKEITWKDNPFIIVVLFQIFVIYFFAGINKTSIEWWNGSAISLVLKNVTLNKPLAYTLIKKDIICKILTYATLGFEIIGSLIFIFNLQSKKVRFYFGILILLFHLGVDFFLDVGFYKYTGILIASLLLPDYFWNKIQLKNISFRLYTKSMSRLMFLDKLKKEISFILFSLILIFSIFNSVSKQLQNYDVKANNFLNFYEKIKPSNLSPFKQSWSMFAPGVGKTNGFITFEKTNKKTKKIEYISAINPLLIKNNYKSYPMQHPCKFFMEFCTLDMLKKNSDKNILNFKLECMFEYEILKDIKMNSKNYSYQLIFNIKDKHNKTKRTKVLEFDNP